MFSPLNIKILAPQRLGEILALILNESTTTKNPALSVSYYSTVCVTIIKVCHYRHKTTTVSTHGLH